MSLEADATRGVKTWYGPQDLSQSEARSLTSVGKVKEMTVVVTGSDYASVSFTLPKGSIVVDSFVEVTEAFALGGTTPTLALGTSGSAPTNSIVDVTEANAEAIGTYQGVPAGTLAAGTPLAADTTIVVELGGSTPTITSAGKAYVSFRYRLDAR